VSQDLGRTLEAVSALTARDRRLQAGSPVSDDDQLRALLESVAALTAAGIRCALIGGMAVGVRAGVPRATVDVDLAVATRVSRQDVIAALAGAGFEVRHPSGEPVQVAFDEAFDAVVERAEPVAVGDFEVPVALGSDLIVMKERAARDPSRGRSKALRDLADVELLRGDVPGEDDGW
jgi:predicted nucleotidyltransferase